MSQAFIYYAYSFAWKVTRSLPAKVSYGIFRTLGDFIYSRNSGPIRRLRSNYARVRPELSEEELELLVKEGMRSYMRYWCDTFRLCLLYTSPSPRDS